MKGFYKVDEFNTTKGHFELWEKDRYDMAEYELTDKQ